MCLAVPVRVTEVHDRHWATVEMGGTTKRIAIDLVEGVQVGDYVLLHVGFALQKMDEVEARATLALFDELLEDTTGGSGAIPIHRGESGP